MSTVQDLLDKANSISASLVDVKAKLDVIQALVAKLEAGTPVTQEQLDSIGAALDSANASVATVSSEEDTIR